MRKVYLGLVVCCLATSACGTPGSTPQELSPTGQYGVFDRVTGSFHQSSLVAAPTRPPDTLTEITTKQAVALLPKVFAALSIPITSFDPQTHLIASSNQPVTLHIGELRPSMVLDCGMGAYGPNADRYQVSLTVLTGVSGDSMMPAIVETRLSARAVANGLSSYVPCSSTGKLEEEIAQKLRSQKMDR